jgi:hypothetical protein
VTASPYTDIPARLASALRARPDGWAPAAVERIGSALALYPEMRAAIGGATVNGLDGDVWMEPTDTGAMLSVYGPFGTLLYRETVCR